MGRVSDNIRNRMAGRPVKKIGSEIGIETYFIRLKKSWWKRFWTMLQGKEDQDVFIHYESQDGEQVAYRAKKGIIGACIFKLDAAIDFIKESSVNNLELVKINKVVNQ